MPTELVVPEAGTRELSYAEAIREALAQAMQADERVFLFGEDVGVYGGAFGVSGDLFHRFGPDRVIDTPISELGIAGAAVGAAITGMKPVLELQFSDFVTLAMEQIVNQAAKIHFMFGGKATVPMVVRLPGGSGTGAAAQHSQSLEAWFAHVPGLKVVQPSTPHDAKGLLLAAIDDPNPVLIFEHKLLYKTRGPVPEDPYRVPIGKAAVRRAGHDLTIVGSSIMSIRAVAASRGEHRRRGHRPALAPPDRSDDNRRQRAQDAPAADRLRRRQDHGHRRRDLGDDRRKRCVRFSRRADRAARRRRRAAALQSGARKGGGPAGGRHRRRGSPPGPRRTRLMPIEVILPKVDMDMDDGIITEWKVAPGDRVRQGQILFDIETNKSVMEVESPGSGVIRDLAPITGEPVAVGTVVGWIDGDSDAHAVASPATADRTGTTPPAAATAGADHAASSPKPVASAEAATVAPSDSIRATPLARRTARMLDVNLADVVGSGPAGRIVEKDVAAHAGPARESSVPITDRLVPFNPVRRIVAQRLAESARSAPHFFLSAQIEMSALQAALRGPEGQRASPDHARASMTVALAYLAGRVLALHPLLNASIEGDAVRLHARVNIGVAIDDQGDLFVPVLRDVPMHSLDELAREFARLRAAVRAREIVPDDMRGGTFTISNLGMYGVDAFTAIINPPESAILAIGRTIDTPVGRDGKVVLRPMATFTLSSDHRIVDGVTAARFVADLREAIEHPDGLS